MTIIYIKMGLIICLGSDFSHTGEIIQINMKYFIPDLRKVLRVSLFYFCICPSRFELIKTTWNEDVRKNVWHKDVLV